MHHIPTRTEMDEVQRVVVELRRELRAMKRVKKPEAPVAKRAPVKRTRK
mgnify:CR=1 FL=1